MLGLAFVALATVAWAAPVAATTPLSRRIFDRLSLIYLMDGEMEKSITLQKEAMDRSEAAQNDLIARRGAELVRLLEARGALAEAERWRNEIARHGSTADLDRTPPVVSRPASTPTAARPHPRDQKPAPTETSPAQGTAARSARPPAAPAPVATRPEPAAAAQGPSDTVIPTTAESDAPTAMAATGASAGEEAVGLPTTEAASQRFKRRDSYAKGIAALKRSLAREAAAVPATATAPQPPDPAPVAAAATSLSPAAGNPDEAPGPSSDRKPVKPVTAPAISASAPAAPPAAPRPEPGRAMPRPASPPPPPVSEPARPAAVTPPPDAPRPVPTGIPAPSEAAAASKPAPAARPAPVPAATPAPAEHPIVAITPGTGREVVIDRPAAKAEPSRAGPVETGRSAAPPAPAAAPPAVTSARASTPAAPATAAPRPTTAPPQHSTITRPGPASARTDDPTPPAPRTSRPSPQSLEAEAKPAAGRLRLFPERDTPLPPPPLGSAGPVEPARPSQPAGSARPIREEVVVERRVLDNNREEIIVERQNQTYRPRQAVTALARTLADTAPAEPATVPRDTGPLLRSTELVKRVVEPAPPGVRPGETTYRLQAPSLLPADLPRLPIRTEEEPRQAVVRQTKATSELAAISPIKVTLNFRDVEIADIVRLLATKANLNIISRRQITGRTTVNFEDIPVGTALDTILRHNDYAYELRDGIIWIFPQGDEPSETRVFFVRHVAAGDLVEIVRQNLQQLEADHRRSSSAMTTMATPAAPGQTALDPVTGRPLTGDTTANAPGGSAPDSLRTGSSFSGSTGRWHLQVDDRSNSLIVTAPRGKLEEIARLLEVFDLPMESRRLEERIFKVKYIDRATLEKAIKMVLPRFDPEKQMLDVNRVDLRGGGGGSGAGSGSTASAGAR
ncbi:MAG: Vegetative cell wall protein gp1 precursor (Hydroxyproline-rich glycoprotein 1) [Candidatus Ozemobacter sibiricus]|uniref:Vegetative cell wall protein gp1 (Hydroxyproline-rich glycoprotein 1) n=1 Tax=Candidatus Ozemobacter sibiricus TaxID=2268124 RepID=A0A367ZPW7_9BACT|nr:MAG: Vegetative cell wall protein gp1 precursor (Hydroxyproline-rich glycoprotein 1) [Candidatus Ozemobacter sibiricus]